MNTWRIGLALMFLVGVIAGAVQSQQSARPLYALPDPDMPVISSASMILTGDGRQLITANMLNDTISLIDVQTARRIREIEVGRDPRSVATTPDGMKILVLNRVDGTLSVIDFASGERVRDIRVGRLPYGVVTDDNLTAYVTLQGENVVLKVDLTRGDILERIPTHSEPTGLLLWGDFLYVTHFWTGQLSLIYRPQATVVRTISTGETSSLMQSLAVDPVNGRAFLPHSRSNPTVGARNYDTMIFPVVSVVDLAEMVEDRNQRLALDVVDRPVNMPFFIHIDATRGLIYVANAGSNDVSVVDPDSGSALAHIEVGASPRSLLMGRNGERLFVHNTIDGTVTVIDLATYRVQSVVVASDLRVSLDILLGAQLFYGADDTRLTPNNSISCASCHFDGLSDGRSWDLPGIGLRNTPSLFDLSGTAPYTWSGAWDEVADVELKIRGLMSGTGLVEGAVMPADGESHAGLSLDLDTLILYLHSLPVPSSSDVYSPDIIERGGAVFTTLDCARCHSGAAGTDGLSHDVGTGGMWNTPGLFALWQTAPYLHDGRAQSLGHLFALPGQHQIVDEVNPDEIAALIAYLYAHGG